MTEIGVLRTAGQQQVVIGILDAAREENSRTYLITYLLMKLGLTRTELLALKVDHVDVASDPDRPVVYIYYDEIRWQPKERKLSADAEFTDDRIRVRPPWGRSSNGPTAPNFVVARSCTGPGNACVPTCAIVAAA